MKPSTRLGLGAGVLVCSLPLLFLGPARPADAAPPITAWNQNHRCTFCHDPHGTINPSNLRSADVEVLCLTCHGPGGISTQRAAIHNVDGHRITCVVCHDPHRNLTNWVGGENLKLVGKKDAATALPKIQTPHSGLRQVVFESRGTNAGGAALHSFADGDQDANGYYDGVCETCHTNTEFHRNTSSGNHTHHRGETCTSCHLHRRGFKED